MNGSLYRRGLSLLLAGCALLSCAACGGTAAATMHLRRTEGTVAVADSDGKGVEPKENLGLYSGYGVDTRTESYAWIDLDSVKLTKLDQDSEIAITKEGKKLEIEVKSGSLFFNVTQPLEEDETMNIRTSTMAVGIRGTCGWVTQDTAALLEGTVEVTAGEQSVTVSAGEMAVVTAGGEIKVTQFSAEDIPIFVEAELEAEFLEKVLTEIIQPQEPNPQDPQTGTEVDNGEDHQETGTGQDMLEQYRQIIQQADSYEYDVWPVNANEGFRYALVQEEGFPVPTLILEKLGLDRHGFLLFRYNPDTGVTDEVGSDSVTRFEFPSHSFINEINYDEWYNITDTSGLDAWASTIP